LRAAEVDDAALSRRRRRRRAARQRGVEQFFDREERVEVDG
jgi:hypothetical protein